MTEEREDESNGDCPLHFSGWRSQDNNITGTISIIAMISTIPRRGDASDKTDEETRGKRCVRNTSRWEGRT